MRVLVAYSSLSGNTKRLAEGIAEGLRVQYTVDLFNLSEGMPEVNEYDATLIGYWVDKGGPDARAKKFLSQLQGQRVGLFATLGFYADSQHAWDSIRTGVDIVNKDNTLIGTYIANGSLSPQIIERFRKAESGSHSATPENEARWSVMAQHPSRSEIACATERFTERLTICGALVKQGLDFPAGRLFRQTDMPPRH